MDSINEKKSTNTFPFESLHRFRTAVSPDIEKDSDYAAHSYDNRGRVSDMAASLQSKLGYFQTRLAASSFLSEAFSWQVKTAKTSDPDRLLAKADASADEKDFSVEIDTLATIRTAVSNRLASDDATVFETGTYSYTLTIGTDVTAVSIDIENEIGAPATNRSVLLSLERSINRLGLDVTATLTDTIVRDYNPYRENAYKDVSYLTVSSTTTGEDTAFSLLDTSGDLIESLGLDSVNSFGHKNQYRIDGTQAQSNSNNIDIASGKVSGYLLGTTDSGQNLKINVSPGKNALAFELTQIINDYNELIRWIDENDSVISPNLKTTLFKDLSSIATRDKSLKAKPAVNTDNAAAVHVDFATVLNLENKNTIDGDLADIGLTLNNDGTIDISEEFSASVTENLRQVHDALAGTNGFFTKISDAMENIHSRKESNYVFAFNSILSYDANGTNRRSIYKTNSSSIISFFA
ncbi:MAG: flagellar filament capping protein FliD [Proteobacteria bacterium]|nr:flagellar filament capping protein FliD [Pseudomonadota bacterium]MBU1581333.1 flagellar filament capping protein FliD [Pseudomonadota bacterium]